MTTSPIRAAVLAVGALLLLAGVGFAAGNRPSGTDDSLAASAAASASTEASTSSRCRSTVAERVGRAFREPPAAGDRCRVAERQCRAVIR